VPCSLLLPTAALWGRRVSGRGGSGSEAMRASARQRRREDMEAWVSAADRSVACPRYHTSAAPAPYPDELPLRWHLAMRARGLSASTLLRLVCSALLDGSKKKKRRPFSSPTDKSAFASFATEIFFLNYCQIWKMRSSMYYRKV
jgi:hypothetical protein